MQEPERNEEWDEHDFDHLYLGPPVSDITPALVCVAVAAAFLLMGAMASIGIVLAWCI